MSELWSQMRNQIGWQGISGIVLLSIAWAFFTTVLHPLEELTAWTREEIMAANQRTALDGSIGRSPSTPALSRLANFYSFLSTDRAVTDELAKIYNLADRNGLELSLGEYRLEQDKTSRLAAYQISLPVKGAYAKIRTFAASALADIPSLSLDSIKFQRKKSGETAVEAEIKFTLYLTRA